MPRAASSASLQAGIARLRKKWSLPPTNRSASETSSAEKPEVTIAGERSRRSISVPARLRLCASSPICSIWVRIPVTSTGPATADGGLQQRAENVAQPAQPGEHVGPVGAVAEHLAEPLVERAERTPAAGGVLEDPQPHRRRDHPGHRPDRGAVVARLERDRRCRPRTAPRRPRGRRRAPPARRPPSARPAAARTPGPLDRRAGVQELPLLRARAARRPAPRRPGSRSPRAPRPAPARWRRLVAGRRPRPRGRLRFPPSAAASRPG